MGTKSPTAWLAALSLLAALGALQAAAQDKTEATKVAKKVERAQAGAHEAKEEREAIEEFAEDVAKYAVLHGRALVGLASREQSLASQEALARAISRKRVRAEPGDIFRPEVQPLFRRLLAEQLQGPDAADAREALHENDPEPGEAPVVVHINGVYPLGAPRSTVPASVLATLPPLPTCLHYRFVGRDLVLVDSQAGVVVDILTDATPPPPATRKRP
ncbi:MAG: hypothetical protein NDJ94_10105 [Vicinamibacteria bacterium]|nr:hypothetical protein [Vicinamibacteria bacterium]